MRFSWGLFSVSFKYNNFYPNSQNIATSIVAKLRGISHTADYSYAEFFLGARRRHMTDLEAIAFSAPIHNARSRSGEPYIALTGKAF
jgi:hypothetical protein